MKKYITALLLIAATLFIKRSHFQSENVVENENVVLTYSTENNTTENTYDYSNDQDSYTSKWVFVNNIDQIQIHTNFSEKLTSNEFLMSNNCSLLTNGGFYTKENKPIGLLISNKNTISLFENNNLFNAILSINLLDTPRITDYVPKDPLKHAIQSGPMLINNSFVQNLNNTIDINSRRLIAATTGDNDLIFMVIYDKLSTFQGPLLSDLPKAIQEISDNNNLNISDALNLDGGGASVFISKTTKLTEMSPVGTYICVK